MKITIKPVTVRHQKALASLQKTIRRYCALARGLGNVERFPRSIAFLGARKALLGAFQAFRSTGIKGWDWDTSWVKNHFVSLSEVERMFSRNSPLGEHRLAYALRFTTTRSPRLYGRAHSKETEIFFWVGDEEQVLKTISTAQEKIPILWDKMIAVGKRRQEKNERRRIERARAKIAELQQLVNNSAPPAGRTGKRILSIA